MVLVVDKPFNQKVLNEFYVSLGFKYARYELILVYPRENEELECLCKNSIGKRSFIYCKGVDMCSFLESALQGVSVSHYNYIGVSNIDVIDKLETYLQIAYSNTKGKGSSVYYTSDFMCIIGEKPNITFGLIHMVSEDFEELLFHIYNVLENLYCIGVSANEITTYREHMLYELGIA